MLFYEGRKTETGTTISAAELGFSNGEYVAYEPSAWRWLRLALRNRVITDKDVLVDVGCGKGRVLLQAARRYPFGRLIGVEVSDVLAAWARRNLAVSRDRLRVRDVVIENANATEWEVPDDVTYAYFFNPFEGETFHRALANLIASLDRSPRRLTLIYANPVMAGVVEATGRFELVETIKRPLRPDVGETNWVKVYESREGKGKA